MTDTPTVAVQVAAAAAAGPRLSLPDMRGWTVLGLFALSAYVLWLLSSNTRLADSQLFTALATAIVVSGLIGGVVSFLFGSSKSSADVRAQLGQALDKLPGSGGQP